VVKLVVKNGYIEGEYIQYYENGNIEIKYCYKNGKRERIMY
jgi:antitoxin component YwqK of YwqJK toxin-antitoxin module